MYMLLLEILDIGGGCSVICFLLLLLSSLRIFLLEEPLIDKFRWIYLCIPENLFANHQPLYLSISLHTGWGGVMFFHSPIYIRVSKT